MSKSTSDTRSETDARIIAMDDAKLGRWPVPYESLAAPTRYGDTRILVSGPKDSPPLVLLHAMGVTSTMWLPNIAALSREYRTYALDTIGDIGRSRLDNPDFYPKHGQEFSQWLVDVFEQLDIGQAHVIGSSYGGWITMNHAIYAPERVKRIVLLGPMGLPTWLTTLKVISQIWSVMLFPTQTNIEKTIRWGLGEHPSVREGFADYMTLGAKSLSRFKLPPPRNFSDDQLRKIGSPTLLVLGEGDRVIGDARETAARARRLIPNAQIEIVEAGHMMSTEQPELVNTRILRFLRE